MSWLTLGRLCPLDFLHRPHNPLPHRQSFEVALLQHRRPPAWAASWVWIASKHSASNQWSARPGQWCSGTLRWRRVPSGEEVGNIGYEANLIGPVDAWLRLSYRVNDEPQDQRITLEATRPNYGGNRWWFRCPATGHRVAKLHLPPGGHVFASRGAYGLAYQSQRERAYERALTRTQDIRMKLGGSPSLAEPFPDKPKGMWWRTYRRLRGEAREAEYQSWLGVAQRLGIVI